MTLPKSHHANAQRNGRVGRPPGTPTGRRTAREELYRAQADKARFDLDLKQGEYIELAKVEAARTAEVIRARTIFEGFPSRAKIRLPHLTTHDLTELGALVREVLAELAGDEGGRNAPTP
jgi:phage terminase Nu1 subunit (DNA packaging protein)